MDVYEIIKTIGSGSFGQVYLARHKREGKNYVIKRVKTRDMSQKDLENTENEVRLLQKIRHTNIVAYKDSYVDRESYLNLVMVYCDGGDIYSKIKATKGKNFPESQIIDWLAQMALALFYLHERRILHRDMKTQNIFLKNGKIRLGDFGIAKVLDSTKDFANTCIGTPYYMSPELFKNKPYSYKSDVWALGCVLYEMCNLRHAFDAQSINGLAVKILRGSYPPLNTMYSKGLRDLIGRMLSVKPQERPTILDILNKMIVRKRVTSYIIECVNGPAPELAITDVNDMYVDSLTDQAEKLQIPGFSNEDNCRPGKLQPLQGGINPKKLRQALQPEPDLQTEEAKIKELKRLKRELQEKERIEKRIRDLEEEALQKEKAYQEKYHNAEKRRLEQLEVKQAKAVRASKPYQNQPSNQRSSSVPAERKQKFAGLRADSQEAEENKETRPHAYSQNESEGSPQKEELLPSSTNEFKSLDPPSSQHILQKKVPASSNHLLEGPLSTYQDFKNVFNAKNVGGKSNRRSALPTTISQKSQSIDPEDVRASKEGHLSARERVLLDKDFKRQQNQAQHEAELERIRTQNAKLNIEASYQQKIQYRQTGQTIPTGKQKKIEEDYTMFDEPHGDLDDDFQLQEIIEETLEEESGESEDDGDELADSKELRDERAAQKDEIRVLKTQLMTIREKLADKTAKINDITANLQNQSAAGEFNFEGMAHIEDDGLDSERDDLLSEDDFEADRDDYEDLVPSDINSKLTDPQITKIHDKIRLLRHRCAGSIGNSIFEQAMDYLRENDIASLDVKRSGLEKILGDDQIGFWAVMDQILFYEQLALELSTQASSN